MAVTVIDAPHTSYSWTAGLVRVIANAPDLIKPSESPFLDRVGMSSANGWDGLAGVKNTKVEWQEDAMAAMSTTLNGSIASDATTITVADGSLLKAGDVVLVDSEYIHVTSVSAEVATVTRNYGGTQATHATAATVQIVGMARLEGATGDFDVMTGADQPYNYTGIVQTGLKLTGTDLAMSYLGIDDLNAYQGDKNVWRWGQKMELNYFHGQRKEGSATTPRGAGGLGTFITSDSAGYIDAGADLVTMDDFDNAMEGLEAVGGKPTLAVMHPSRYADVHRSLGDAVQWMESQTSDDMVGHKQVRGIRTAFGDLEILRVPNCQATKIWLLDPSRIGGYMLREVAQKNLAIVGDAYPSELLGEGTLCVKNGLKAHGVITNTAS
jgi:hypothetical protein